MNVTDVRTSTPPAPQCPHASAAAGAVTASAVPALRRVSEVERDCSPDATLAGIVRWLREFIARPHPDLGRPGSICPFVPNSLNIDSIWLAEVTEENPSEERIAAIITEYRNVFLDTEPKSGPESMNKAFMVAFPSLIAHGTEGNALVDRVQYRLKPLFVERGIMLGEFHSTNESPGLRNPDFRPLRSPVPMLAIRHMVESDLPFMTRDNYSPSERSAFLRSYLFRLGGVLRQSKFDEALEHLVTAEAAMASAADESQMH
jgi:hypothetical protein